METRDENHDRENSRHEKRHGRAAKRRYGDDHHHVGNQKSWLASLHDCAIDKMSEPCIERRNRPQTSGMRCLGDFDRSPHRVRATIQDHTLRSSERYPTASAMFCGLMSSCLPGRRLCARPSAPCRERGPRARGLPLRLSERHRLGLERAELSHLAGVIRPLTCVPLGPNRFDWRAARPGPVPAGRPTWGRAASPQAG